MRASLFVILIIFSVSKTHAQELLANGSFEDRNICIEFRAGCAPEAWFRIPLVPVTIHNGPDRNHYVNIIMENLRNPFSARNYIYTRLLCPLEPGKKYRFKTMLRANEESFDHLDVLMIPYEPNRNKQLLTSEKQKVSITPQQLVQDNKSSDWEEYAFEFTATGKERYLILGNFSKNAWSKQQDVSLSGDISYDIDNVSLLPVGELGPGCPEASDNKTILYRNNSRHTINNFLDDEDPFVREPEKIPEPSKKAVVVPVVNDTLIIPDVLFKFNSAELNPKFIRGLDSLITKIRSINFKQIEVIGHTDSLGTHAINTALSLHRAETVRKFVMDKLHFPYASISADGKAALVPVATNKTAAGRQKNRRVEIVLVK